MWTIPYTLSNNEINIRTLQVVNEFEVYAIEFISNHYSDSWPAMALLWLQ